MGIALCMIVKNEEDWVEGAAESVSSIVDDVIIVDTGSTDSTIARAQALGATVLKYQWEDSFALARNVSLTAARQPWILVLDADERIAARDLCHIKDATASGAAPDGYHLNQRNYVFKRQVFGWAPNTNDYAEGAGYDGYVDNPLIRLFRNSPEIRFEGSVHEIINPNRLPHLKFSSIPVVLHHYGKVRGEKRLTEKQHLYLALGMKKVSEDPGNAKARFDLGIQYQELGRHEEAANCFRRTFDMNRLPIALLYWAISEKHLNRNESAARLLYRALAAGLDTFDLHLELGNVHLALGEWVPAQTEYNHCLALDPQNPIPVFNYGLVLRKMGDADGAIDYYNRALRLDAAFREPLMELAILHLQSNRPDEALQALNAVSETDAIALSLIGAAHLQKDNLDEAQKNLEGALRKNRSLTDARLNLAQVYRRRGDFARAARYMQSMGTI